MSVAINFHLKEGFKVSSHLFDGEDPFVTLDVSSNGDNVTFFLRTAEDVQKFINGAIDTLKHITYF